MGYSAVNKDLMCRYGNKPYIIVELAFMALIPSALSETLACKLKDYYIDCLKSDLSAHDKIEFEIALSCFDFCTKDKLINLKAKGFTEEEINSINTSLYNLTLNAINDYKKVLRTDTDSLQKLEAIRKECFQKYNKNTFIQSISKIIHKLLNAITEFGTAQFSRHARYAFIARSIAQSLKNKGYWSSLDFDNFMARIHTVTSDLEQAFKDLQTGAITKERFFETYGHLRAGTYDITKPRYDMQDIGIFNTSPLINKQMQSVSVKDVPDAVLLDAQLQQKTEKALQESNISINAEELLSFMKTSLEQREYFKFTFTKSLSFVLELIAEIAQKLNVTREEIAFFDINEIISFCFYGVQEEIKQYILELLPVRKKEYALYSKLILPSVFTKTSDFDFIQITEVRPNFISTKIIKAPVAFLDTNNPDFNLQGKIVAIEKAAPGYDWIFTKGIAGLITCYGGVASHMAIRCAEFELPAAIGCGQTIFDFASKQNVLCLDCKHGKITKGIL